MSVERICYSVPEAAAATGYSETRIRKSIRERHLTGGRPGGKGDHRILTEDLKFLLDYLFRHENKDNILNQVPRFLDPICMMVYEDAHFAYTGKPKVYYSGGRKPTQDEQEYA